MWHLHIQLPAKLLGYFLRGNKSNINQSCHVTFVCLVSLLHVPLSFCMGFCTCCWVLHFEQYRALALHVCVCLCLYACFPACVVAGYTQAQNLLYRKMSRESFMNLLSLLYISTVQDKILFTFWLHLRWWRLADTVSITWHLLWCNLCCSVLQCVAVVHGFWGSKGVAVPTRPPVRHQAADLCSHVTYSHEFVDFKMQIFVYQTLCALCVHPNQS